MQKMASIIYEHPYTVSNESRATRSRLLDMRFFIMSMFTRPDWSEQDLQQLLNERYEMQYHSIGIISRQYLGPKEDADQLQKAMEALEKTQNEALPIVVNLDEQETIKYVEANLYPKYDAVNDALETIIDYADKKVQKSGKEFKKAWLQRLLLPPCCLHSSFPPISCWPSGENRRTSRKSDTGSSCLTTFPQA